MPGVSVNNPLIAKANAAAAARGNVGRGGTRQEPKPTQPPPKANAAPKPANNSAVTGLCEALNKFQLQLVADGKYDAPDEYIIEFAPAVIADSAIVRPGNVNKRLTPSQTTTTAADSLLPEKQSVNTGQRTTSIQAGMQILQFIDQQMRNSSWIGDQQNVTIDPVTNEYKVNGKPAQSFSWFNITTQVEPTAYDAKRNDFAYKMTFTITPYEMPVRSEYFPESGYRGVHKHYNYWFTGQNTSVLRFEQAFNKAYVEVISGRTTTQQLYTNYNGAELFKRAYQPRSGQSDQGSEGSVNEPAANAADFLYSADYQEIKLNIVGDPAWLYQGRIGIGPETFSFSPFFPDGTINLDASAVYFDFSWNQPVDYNLDTGLMDPGQNNFFANRQTGAAGIAKENVVYQAISVKSTFSKGRFEQELVGKWRTQPAEKVVTKQDNARPATAPAKAPAARRTVNKANDLPRSTVTNPILANTSSVAKGTQQILQPTTNGQNLTDAELRGTPVYNTARRSGDNDATALVKARSASAAGTNNYGGVAIPGIRTGPQKIVREE